MENSTTFFPQVYFELGELAGYGIVNVSVNWQKPFRDMRYVNASLSFEITIESDAELPTEPERPTSRRQEVSFESLVYEYKVNLGLTDEQAKRLVNDLGAANTLSVEDFIAQNDISDNAKNIKRGLAESNFNYTVQRVENVFETFRTATGREVITDLEIFNTIKDFTYEQLITPDKRGKNKIKEAKDAFKKYLDYYYNNENTSMTRDEYNQVLDSVFLMLEKLEELAEEIVGYGASS